MVFKILIKKEIATDLLLASFRDACSTNIQKKKLSILSIANSIFR